MRKFMTINFESNFRKFSRDNQLEQILIFSRLWSNHSLLARTEEREMHLDSLYRLAGQYRCARGASYIVGSAVLPGGRGVPRYCWHECPLQ
jgi:hypothetical protein